jgi:ADP-ribose pyrophosphatase YjhB (NUDIX family)
VSRIRPIAIGIFRRGEAILVGCARDAKRAETYYRPPGGGIEFGERAAEALRREMREEVRLEIAEPSLIGVLENTFELEGVPKHEIVFVLASRFVDEGAYQREGLTLYEAGWDGMLIWKDLAVLREGGEPLYPTGLLDLLSGTA